MLKALTTTCLAALTSAAVILTPAPAAAQFEGRSADEVVEVSLIEGWRMENGRHMAGIRIALAPGWKTYWRAPGEGGVPTVLRLRSAEGIDGMAIHWPRPEVFFTNGIRSIGYQGRRGPPGGIRGERRRHGRAGRSPRYGRLPRCLHAGHA
jgi:DsbC/DsbD-like thiol-disulfide interchange protein